LGTTRIRSVWANDNSGSIVPQVIKGENTTTIKLSFSEKVVGKGNTLSFTLGYISDDYAMKNGRVLEIGIPKIAETSDLSDYSVNLTIPYSFESPAFIMPQPSNITQSDKGNVYFFNKQVLQDKGIFAAFGNFQVMDFNLKYHLYNKNNKQYFYQIALPPDTDFQKVFYDTLSPLPEKVEVDQDGNWLASYLIKASSNLEVTATGSAQIFINPQDSSYFKKDVDQSSYLISQKYWESDNPEIKALASQLKTPLNIYNFLVNNLIYDYAKVEGQPERMGALSVLNNKDSAICMEFTDLFIALARAAGIPAREVNGFAYTNNPKLRPLSLSQDILHAWPQYYDQKQQLWLSIDPTWGNTTGGIDFFHKLDLNHFAFVFHGLDSEYPFSPGSYKDVNDKQKDVDIKFSNQDINLQKKVKVDINLASKQTAGLAIKGTVRIYNQGNYALYNQTLTYSSTDLNIEEKKIMIDVLPPFGFFELKLNFPKTSIFLSDDKKVLFNFDNQDYSHIINIKSVFPSPIGGGLDKVFTMISTFLKKLAKVKS